jgi:hypothetical protein
MLLAPRDGSCVHRMRPDDPGMSEAPRQRREVVVNGKRVRTVDVHAHRHITKANALMGLKVQSRSLAISSERVQRPHADHYPRCDRGKSYYLVLLPACRRLTGPISRTIYHRRQTASARQCRRWPIGAFALARPRGRRRESALAAVDGPRHEDEIAAPSLTPRQPVPKSVASLLPAEGN